MARRESLSPAEARRAVLAAQGFGRPAAGRAGMRQLVATVTRLGLLQIDSVNVLARAHYLPLFSRVGPYERADLDRAARRPARLFEYWAHEASLLPVATQPLLRWRMAQEHAWGGVAAARRTRTDLIPPVLAAISTFGPLTVTQIEEHLEHDEDRQRSEWGWNWSAVKRIVEALFWSGELSSAGRDSSFRRRYDLTERVLPADVLAQPTPERADALRSLVAIAARSLGIATLGDLRDYFRLPAAETRTAVQELVDEGEIAPVAVPGWPQAYRHRDLRIPRNVSATALLVPFDPLIWHRERVERMFGMRYRIEIYVPAQKREFGYYVLPFLDGDRLTARVDLRADRPRRTLEVLGAWDHPSAAGIGAAPDALGEALGALASWLGLSELRVAPRGDLAGALAGAVAAGVR